MKTYFLHNSNDCYRAKRRRVLLTWLQRGGQQRVDVDGKLGSDPLVAPLPARAVQEDVVPVLSHVLHQVVCEPEVGSGGAEQLPEFWVVDLDQGFFYLQVSGYKSESGHSRGYPSHTLKSNYWEVGAGNKKYGY